jgi:hypothetical protein
VIYGYQRLTLENSFLWFKIFKIFKILKIFALSVNSISDKFSYIPGLYQTPPDNLSTRMPLISYFQLQHHNSVFLTLLGFFFPAFFLLLNLSIESDNHVILFFHDLFFKLYSYIRFLCIIIQR